MFRLQRHSHNKQQTQKTVKLQQNCRPLQQQRPLCSGLCVLHLSSTGYTMYTSSKYLSLLLFDDICKLELEPKLLSTPAAVPRASSVTPTAHKQSTVCSYMSTRGLQKTRREQNSTRSMICFCASQAHRLAQSKRMLLEFQKGQVVCPIWGAEPRLT